MDKITQVNIEGHNYGFVAGQAVRGVSGAQAADYVKTVILPEGASLVEGMLLAVTFVNGNTAGFAGAVPAYSSDGVNFFYDPAQTNPIVLPPASCYTMEHVSGNEYSYLAYICLSVNNELVPVSDASGYLSGGPLWDSGDTVLLVYLGDFFMMTSRKSAPSDYSRQGAYCATAGSVQAKEAQMIGYAVQNGQDFPITFTEDNTYSDKITLSINGTTAYDIYLNGAVSSSTNYTLPAGTYMLHYENNKYYIETSWGVPFARRAQNVSGVVAVANGGTGQTNLNTLSIGKSGNSGSKLTIKGATVNTNTYADTNPKLEFQNTDASQDISLTFSDYDSVQAPSSLTLNGNQGGEYFIAPNIKATTRFYGALTGNVTGNCSGSSGSCTGNSATASKVVGNYTGSGGQQNPQYVGKNRVCFNMMNTSINGNTQYKDFIMMDCYSGFDVGGTVGIGVSRQSMRVFAMRANAGTSPNRPTSWAESCEINTSSYTQVPTSQPSTLNNGAIWVV